MSSSLKQRDEGLGRLFAHAVRDLNLHESVLRKWIPDHRRLRRSPATRLVPSFGRPDGPGGAANELSTLFADRFPRMVQMGEGLDWLMRVSLLR